MAQFWVTPAVLRLGRMNFIGEFAAAQRTVGERLLYVQVAGQTQWCFIFFEKNLTALTSAATLTATLHRTSDRLSALESWALRTF